VARILPGGGSNNATTGDTIISPPANLGQALDRYKQSRKGEHGADSSGKV
jgi:hypothetical protein